MRRLVPLALLLAVAAGCGSTKHVSAPPPSPAALLGGSKVLYTGGDWAVVTRGSHVLVAHRSGNVWRPDRSGTVKVNVLGPGRHAVARPQVAAEISGPSRIVEEGLWIDGVELLEKGGGLKPDTVTVYGAPDGNLKPGKHVAVAYGRTARNGTAVAWTFTVV